MSFADKGNHPPESYCSPQTTIFEKEKQTMAQGNVMSVDQGCFRTPQERKFRQVRRWSPPLPRQRKHQYSPPQCASPCPLVH